MSNQTRPASLTSVAWLSTPAEMKFLSVTGRATGPEVGALSFFAPDFALNSSTPWLTGRKENFVANAPRAVPDLERRVEPSASAFARLHEEILGRIDKGEFVKVVPVVGEELVFAEPLDPAMFPATFATQQNQFGYGFCLEGEGMCGITPELLFGVNGRELTTMALAGTGQVVGPSLLTDDKEMREHAVVIEHIVGELKAWGTATIGETVEKEFGAIKHLYTPISVQLNKPPDFMELVVRLHPTAALGGWPRRPAIEWLERQSFHVKRGRFGAPFGFVEGDQMGCVVAIRGMEWRERSAQIHTGCGVVRGSEALREWKELALKRNAIYRHLGLDL